MRFVNKQIRGTLEDKMNALLALLVGLFGLYRLIEAAGYYPIDRDVVDQQLIGVDALRKLGVAFVIIDN